MQIIYFLYQNHEGIISDFIYKLKIATNCVSKAVDMLKELGLIEEYNVEGSNKRVFRLTKKGKKMGKLLIRMEEILEED